MLWLLGRKTSATTIPFYWPSPLLRSLVLGAVLLEWAQLHSTRESPALEKCKLFSSPRRCATPPVRPMFRANAISNNLHRICVCSSSPRSSLLHLPWQSPLQFALPKPTFIFLLSRRLLPHYFARRKFGGNCPSQVEFDGCRYGKMVVISPLTLENRWAINSPTTTERSLAYIHPHSASYCSFLWNNIVTFYEMNFASNWAERKTHFLTCWPSAWVSWKGSRGKKTRRVLLLLRMVAHMYGWTFEELSTTRETTVSKMQPFVRRCPLETFWWQSDFRQTFRVWHGQIKRYTFWLTMSDKRSHILDTYVWTSATNWRRENYCFVVAWSVYIIMWFVRLWDSPKIHLTSSSLTLYRVQTKSLSVSAAVVRVQFW